MITSLCIIYNAGGGYKNRSARKFLEKYLKNILKLVDFYLEIWYNVLVRLRGKPRSRSDLLTEEREKVCPCIHNNPPEILRPLSFISPSLKLAYGTVQGNLRSFPVWLVHICYSLENSRSKDRLFFCYINKPTLNQKKSAVQDQKKGGAAERKNGRPPKKKIAPSKTKI